MAPSTETANKAKLLGIRPRSSVIALGQRGRQTSRSSTTKEPYQLPPAKCATVPTEEVHVRIAKAAVSVAVLGSVLLGGAPAFAAVTPSTPAGGPIKVFATPNGNGGGTIVITGAIGDYGHTLTINKNGTPDPNNGNYVRITLHKGTFEVDSATLNAKANKAQPTFNKATCSAALSVTAPVTLFNGTGLYAGITGTVSINETYAFILPRFTSGKNKGQCNVSNSAQPFGQYSSITGLGTVSFS